MSFRVRSMATGQIVPGLPTPRLIEAGGGEAFRLSDIWYLHEPGTMHFALDGVYTRVKIEHAADWRVDVSIQVMDPSVHEGDAPEEYADWFIVEAATRGEAEAKAYEAAAADVQRQYGAEATSLTTIVRTREAVSV